MEQIRKKLLGGRKFIFNVIDKYILYVDYGTQETAHILNLDTEEDNIICNYGQVYYFNGRTYINGRKRLEDGGLDEQYTLYEIEKDGSVLEIGKITNALDNIKYIKDEKIYLNDKDEGVYIINLKNFEKENVEQYNSCRYFIEEYGYIIDTSDLENIKIEIVKL